MAAGGSYRSARPPRIWLPQDVDSLCEVYETALRSAPPQLSDAFVAGEVTNLRNIYLPNTHTMVIGAVGAVYGFISLSENQIMGLFVHPKAQRRGYGRKLMAWAKSRHPTLQVEVFAENQPAIAFYTAQSYEFIADSHHPETNLPLVQLRWAAGNPS